MVFSSVSQETLTTLAVACSSNYYNFSKSHNYSSAYKKIFDVVSSKVVSSPFYTELLCCIQVLVGKRQSWYMLQSYTIHLDSSSNLVCIVCFVKP